MEHGAVDESSSEQQIRESADYTWIVRKNWSSSHSGTGSYGRPAVRQTKMLLGEKFKKFCNSTLNAYLGVLNRFLAFIKLYRTMYG